LLSIPEPTSSHNLTLVVNAVCAAVVVAGDGSKVADYVMSPNERVKCGVTSRRADPDDFAGVIQPSGRRESASDSSQIGHGSVLPQERVRNRVPRQVRNPGDLSSVIDRVRCAKGSAQRSKIVHCSSAPKKRIDLQTEWAGNEGCWGQANHLATVVHVTGERAGAKIDAEGNRTTVADNLPSSQTNAEQGSLVSGVADVAFIGHTLYALTAGAGCSHGLVHTTNAILRVAADGTPTMVADLSAFQKAHPVAHPNPGDFEPDGTWYSMVAVRGKLYAVEPNHGELDVISTNDEIHRVADISATQGHIVPTAVAYHGNFFVGNLHTFPIQEGSSKILKITPSGQVKTVVTGVTTVLGVAFDHEGYMYILENTTGNLFPTPFTGKVPRVTEDGLEEIATGLFLPTAMTFGPDGILYGSNVGFGPPPVGLGQIVKITVPPVSPHEGHDGEKSAPDLDD